MQTSDSKPGWAERPEVAQRIRYVLYAVCAALALAELFVHRHTVMPLERIPAFYAIYGFISLVGVVLLAKLLRRAVSRPENYYSKDETDAA